MEQLEPLELLHADSITAVHSESEDELPSDYFPHGLGALHASLLGRLHGGQLAALQSHYGTHLSAIRCRLIELLAQLELERDSLERGGLLDGPLSPLLCDLHHGGGGSGRLAQQEVHVQHLEKFLVVLSGGSLVFPLEGVHAGRRRW